MHARRLDKVDDEHLQQDLHSGEEPAEALAREKRDIDAAIAIKAANAGKLFKLNDVPTVPTSSTCDLQLRFDNLNFSRRKKTEVEPAAATFLLPGGSPEVASKPLIKVLEPQAQAPGPPAPPAPPPPPNPPQKRKATICGPAAMDGANEADAAAATTSGSPKVETNPEPPANAAAATTGGSVQEINPKEMPRPHQTESGTNPEPPAKAAKLAPNDTRDYPGYGNLFKRETPKTESETNPQPPAKAAKLMSPKAKVVPTRPMQQLPPPQAVPLGAASSSNCRHEETNSAAKPGADDSEPPSKVGS